MSQRRLHILFLSGWCPYPLDNGSRIRQYHLLRHLAQHHQVTLATFLPGEEWRASLPALQACCHKVLALPARPYRARSLRALVGVFSPLPRAITSTYSPEMYRLIQQETQTEDYDVFIAGEIGCASYASAARARTSILDDPECATLYDQLQPTQTRRTRWRHHMTRLKFERYMRRILAQYHGCTHVSASEGEILRRLAPAGFPIEIVPNGVDAEHNRPGLSAIRPDSLVYSGSLLYSANWDAVDHLLREILPLVRHQVAEATLTVTGRHDGRLPGTPDLRQGVSFAGFVEDVRPVVGGSSVAVVPLRQGSGTRLKVLEAMALGVPVVSTSKGVEGLDVTAGQEVIVADQPIDFARAVVGLLRDPVLRQSLAINARKLVEGKYDWRIIGARMNDFVEGLVAKRMNG